MDLEEIKSRINPQYQDVLGTESYERKWLCDEIERLRKERDECLQTIARLDEANLCMHTELATVTKERDELVAALRVLVNECDNNAFDGMTFEYWAGGLREAKAALAKLGADKEAT